MLANFKQLALILFVCSLSQSAYGQDSIQSSPPLYFREDWMESPAETPITQQHVYNSELVMELFGSGKDMIKKSHHDTPLDDPFYVWSGQCEGNWAVTLTKRNSLVDLTHGCVRWRTKNFDRILHVIVCLEDGSWLVSIRGTGETPDWNEFTFDLADTEWKKLDISTVSATENVVNPDLSRIRAIGFTDLEVGGQSASCSRLDWIEVYGRIVKH
ncbi:MAG: hypothetical protein JXB48_13550 [Candidatus Latescibacteria bacterium]|nr:hypothetical protein [Candidatus Latescibacterota bacterium]